jgi:hypothetical protein
MMIRHDNRTGISPLSQRSSVGLSPRAILGYANVGPATNMFLGHPFVL